MAMTTGGIPVSARWHSSIIWNLRGPRFPETTWQSLPAGTRIPSCWNVRLQTQGLMSINPSSNKIQNGNSLVLANPGPPGKMAVKTECVCVQFTAVFWCVACYAPFTLADNSANKSDRQVAWQKIVGWRVGPTDCCQWTRQPRTFLLGQHDGQ